MHATARAPVYCGVVFLVRPGGGKLTTASAAGGKEGQHVTDTSQPGGLPSRITEDALHYPEGFLVYDRGPVAIQEAVVAPPAAFPDVYRVAGYALYDAASPFAAIGGRYTLLIKPAANLVDGDSLSDAKKNVQDDFGLCHP